MIDFTMPQAYPLQINIGSKRYLVVGWFGGSGTDLAPIVVQAGTAEASMRPVILKQDETGRYYLPAQAVDITDTVSVDIGS